MFVWINFIPYIYAMKTFKNIVQTILAIFILGMYLCGIVVIFGLSITIATEYLITEETTEWGVWVATLGAATIAYSLSNALLKERVEVQIGKFKF